MKIVDEMPELPEGEFFVEICEVDGEGLYPVWLQWFDGRVVQHNSQGWGEYVKPFLSKSKYIVKD